MQLKRCCLFLLCGSLPVCGLAQKRALATKGAAPVEAVKHRAAEVPVPPAAKVIAYGQHDVIRINAKLRYTTLIVLPKSEQILDFTCGDKDFWVIDGNQNFAHVKPAKAGARTNINLVTASGNVYSFVFVEVSEMPDLEPDLKIFVELKDDAMTQAASGAPRFVSVQELEKYRQQAQAARDETQTVMQGSRAAIDSGISHFISNVRFPYRYEAGKRPFYVRAMYHDEKFTYLQARPEETPTLYEIKDGKPNLVNFEYKDGVYTVGKILDRGYLVVGKQKMGFVREE
jgi:type IV secretory pathway VirB9-like protein